MAKNKDKDDCLSGDNSGDNLWTTWVQPIDILALVFIGGGIYLKSKGIDSNFAAIVSLISGYYFGQQNLKRK